MAQVEVTAYANRGRRYAVTFQDGRPFIVCSVYRKYGHRLGKLIERQLWQEGDPKMSLTVACAIRAAAALIIDLRGQLDCATYPYSNVPRSRVNRCPSCDEMYTDGQTCRASGGRGGCPMGGDF